MGKNQHPNTPLLHYFQQATPFGGALNPDLSFSDALARTVLNSLSAHIAILDENGVILETNKAWQRYAVQSGMPEDYDHRGINYLEICDATTGSGLRRR